MNTKLYTRVHSLAKGLLDAAEKDNEPFFYRQYEQLQILCEENEKGNKNHPVQWETLADFTEDSDAAIGYYQKALGYAEAVKAHDYIASINFSMATLLKETGQLDLALSSAQIAEEHASKSEDDNLKQDIASLISSLA